MSYSQFVDESATETLERLKHWASTVAITSLMRGCVWPASVS